MCRRNSSRPSARHGPPRSGSASSRRPGNAPPAPAVRLRLQGAAVLSAPGRSPSRPARPWLSEKRIDHQVLGTWARTSSPTGLPPAALRGRGTACLNDTLAEWWRRIMRRIFSWIASVPMPGAQAAAAELERAVAAGRHRGRSSPPMWKAPTSVRSPLDTFWAKAQAAGRADPHPSGG